MSQCYAVKYLVVAHIQGTMSTQRTRQRTRETHVDERSVDGAKMLLLDTSSSELSDGGALIHLSKSRLYTDTHSQTNTASTACLHCIQYTQGNSDVISSYHIYASCFSAML